MCSYLKLNFFHLYLDGSKVKHFPAWADSSTTHTWTKCCLKLVRIWTTFAWWVVRNKDPFQRFSFCTTLWLTLSPRSFAPIIFFYSLQSLFTNLCIVFLAFNLSTESLLFSNHTFFLLILFMTTITRFFATFCLSSDEVRLSKIFSFDSLWL